MKITTQTTIYKDADKEAVVKISETPFFEAEPDLFFRISLPDGRDFDSRNISVGFFLLIKAGPGRVGQPEAPLTLGLSHQVSDKDKLP